MPPEKLNQAPLPYHAAQLGFRHPNSTRRWSALRAVCQFVLSFAACYIGLMALDGKLPHMESGSKKLNIILMISDG